MKFLSFANLIEQGVLFDSHCHLSVKGFDVDRAEVIARAEKAGVKAIIDIGVNMDTSKKAVKDAEEFDIVYAGVGVEPENLVPDSDLFDEAAFGLSDNDFEKWLEEIYQALKVLAQNEKVLMIGETGIDNFWLEKGVKDGSISPDQQEKSLKRQAALFQMHCRLSKELHKPLSIHSRNAINLCLDIVKEAGIEKGQCVFHSLTLDIGDTEESFYDKVKAILNSGYYIGVNGIITFKNAQILRNVYLKIANEKLQKSQSQLDFTTAYGVGYLLETDAPFLAPEPHRGQRNEPGFLINIEIHS